MNWKNLLGWLVVVLGVYMYAQTYGMSPGWVPFTPLGLWNYTGVKTYNLDSNRNPYVKLILRGNLSRGTARAEVYDKKNHLVAKTRVYQGNIAHTVLHYEMKNPDKYTVKLYLDHTDGYLFFDYVAVGQGWEKPPTNK